MRRPNCDCSILPHIGAQENEANNISYLSPRWMEMLRYRTRRREAERNENKHDSRNGMAFRKSGNNTGRRSHTSNLPDLYLNMASRTAGLPGHNRRKQDTASFCTVRPPDGLPKGNKVHERYQINDRKLGQLHIFRTFEALL